MLETKDYIILRGTTLIHDSHALTDTGHFVLISFPCNGGTPSAPMHQFPDFQGSNSEGSSLCLIHCFASPNSFLYSDKQILYLINIFLFAIIAYYAQFEKMLFYFFILCLAPLTINSSFVRLGICPDSYIIFLF